MDENAPTYYELSFLSKIMVDVCTQKLANRIFKGPKNIYDIAMLFCEEKKKRSVKFWMEMPRSTTV